MTSNPAPYLQPPVELRPNKRVKLAARCLGGRIAFVRQHSSVSSSIIGAPGWAGRRSLRASR